MQVWEPLHLEPATSLPFTAPISGLAATATYGARKKEIQIGREATLLIRAGSYFDCCLIERRFVTDVIMELPVKSIILKRS